jgi:hypothetical protein
MASLDRAPETTLAAAGLLFAALVSACGGAGRGSGFGTSPEGSDSSVSSSDDASTSVGGFSSSGFSGSFADGSVPPGATVSEGGSLRDCDPSCATAGGSCKSGLCAIVDNGAGLTAAAQAQLNAGGSPDTTFQWLYPYDRTVFAHGLVSPTLQFAGAADAMSVHITATSLDYTGYFKPGQGVGSNPCPSSAPACIALSQNAWQAVTAAVLGTELVKVAVTKTAGGKVAAPITESWTIAEGTLRGTVYHETYSSPLAGAVGIMRIQVGAMQPTVFKSGCGNVCHSASADGSTLVADTSITASASYDLRDGGALIRAQSDDSFAYGGLYPDGTLLMSSTNYLGGFNATSQLYDTKTGTTIPASGWDGVITKGGTTAFSPDGKHIAFVHEDKDNGRTVAMMDFNVGTKTFSNLVDLATDPNHYLAWPAFTPDGKAVVYHAGSSATFQAGYGTAADLFIVDVATRTVQRLDALDGYTGSGSATYLPANDPALSATPTVMPEAVGGYFWAVFTSHRSYGNLLATNASSGTLGKLWVAAIDVDPSPGKDASHPAFYLDGQELNADNLRGFWTLPPCQPDGSGCASGDQCCTGFCRQVGSTLQCVEPPKGCSNEFEKCTTAADCCMTGSLCINSRCAQPAMPPTQ